MILRALKQLKMSRMNHPLLRGRAGFIVVVVGLHAAAARSTRVLVPIEFDRHAC
jgi:hypothetical protein